MGLSSKQVSSDMNNWNQALLEAKGANTLEFPNTSPMKRQQQQQQQPPEQLKCPRCDSTNTKFCYYNNYNKSQPRHFCKACKRHWTKGGTLRNVPVGGGRKNKRLKLSKTASKSNTTTTTNVTTTTTLMSEISNHNNNVIEDLNFSKAFYQNNILKQQPCSLPHISIGLSPYNDYYSQEIQLPYSKLASFESNPCSISSTITQIQSPNLYNLGNDHANTNSDGLEETIVMNSHDHQPWTMHTTPTNLGSWDDFDRFVSIEEADLTMPWDDEDIKP